jgi:hypothetical protein
VKPYLIEASTRYPLQEITANVSSCRGRITAQLLFPREACFLSVSLINFFTFETFQSLRLSDIITDYVNDSKIIIYVFRKCKKRHKEKLVGIRHCHS